MTLKTIILTIKTVILKGSSIYDIHGKGEGVSRTWTSTKTINIVKIS